MGCKHNNIPTDFRYCPYCGAEIKRIPSLDDLIARRVNVGDEVRFNLNDGTEAAVVVVDKDNNGIRCVLFEGVEDMAMYDGRYWLKVDSVNYPDSDMANRLKKFEYNLPNQLINAIKPHLIVQECDDYAHEIVAKLYPLSITEVFGKGAHSFGLDDTTYNKPIDFFINSIDNRKKYLWYTWLRSPYSSSSSTFCNVIDTGTADANYANYSYGAAPAFTI